MALAFCWSFRTGPTCSTTPGNWARAVPALSPLLKAERADVRSQAMYALAQIAPPEMAQAFQEGLNDQNERVRACAAQGLARIRHPDVASRIQNKIRRLHIAMNYTSVMSVLQGIGSLDSDLRNAAIVTRLLRSIRRNRGLQLASRIGDPRRCNTAYHRIGLNRRPHHTGNRE